VASLSDSDDAILGYDEGRIPPSPASISLLEDDPTGAEVARMRALEEAQSSSTSTQGVTEGPGVSGGSGSDDRPASRNRDEEVVARVSSMDVDHSTASDIPMVTTVNTSSSGPESSPGFEMLSGFGPKFREALGGLLKTLERFASHPNSRSQISWSNGMRDRKIKEVQMALETPSLQLIESLFKDRNVLFKSTVNTTKPDAIIEDTEENSPTKDLECPCVVIHAAVASCRHGKGHKDLCVKNSNPRGKESAVKKLSYPVSRASESGHSPRSPTFTSDTRPGAFRGRGRSRGHKRPERSQSSHRGQASRDSSTGPSRNKLTYGQHKAKMHKDQDPPARVSSSRPGTKTGPVTDARLKTIPSAEQLRKLMARAGTTSRGLSRNEDIRIGQPGINVVQYGDETTEKEATRSSTRSSPERRRSPTPSTSSTSSRFKKPERPPPSSRSSSTSRASTSSTAERPVDWSQVPVRTRKGPAKIGESCIGPDGEIEWHRLPARPLGLPLGITFNARPGPDGKWIADVPQ